MRSSSLRAGLAQRARIVLLAADGVSNTEIAKRVGVSRPTVIDWRARYERSGMTGLDDEPRSGRPRQVDHDAMSRPSPAGGLRPALTPSAVGARRHQSGAGNKEDQASKIRLTEVSTV
jgi:hypothetical protein